MILCARAGSAAIAREDAGLLAGARTEPVPEAGGLLAYLSQATDAAAVSRIGLVTSPFWARRFIEATLPSWGAEHFIETASLLASELVTNAVKFSGGGGPGAGLAGVRAIGLALELLGDELVIEVWDSSPVPPAVAGAAVAGEGDADAEGGRGLMLVQELSREWDCYQPPWGGKVVYCVLDDRVLERC